MVKNIVFFCTTKIYSNSVDFFLSLMKANYIHVVTPTIVIMKFTHNEFLNFSNFDLKMYIVRAPQIEKNRTKIENYFKRSF